MGMSRIKQKLIDATLYLRNTGNNYYNSYCYWYDDLIKYIVMIFQTSTIETYDVFQRFWGIHFFS